MSGFKKYLYLVGNDCFAISLQQSLGVFFSNCDLLKEDNVDSTRFLPFSVLIFTPSFIRSPARLIRWYHRLFSQGVIEWSLVIGILQNRTDAKHLSEFDINGGKDKTLMANRVPGLNVISLPLNIPDILSLIFNMDNRIMDRYGYLRVKNSGELSKLLLNLKNILYQAEKGMNIKSDYYNVEKQLFNLDLNLMIDHHRYSIMKDEIKKSDSIRNKIEIILRELT